MNITAHTDPGGPVWRKIFVRRDDPDDTFVVLRINDTIIIRGSDGFASFDIELSPDDARTILKGLQEAA